MKTQKNHSATRGKSGSKSGNKSGNKFGNKLQNKSFASPWKNLIITLLLALTIYQAVSLWFEDFSFSALFYAYSETEAEAINRPFFTPSFIIANDGGGEASGQTAKIYYNVSQIMAEQKFEQILSSEMEFIDEVTFDDILAERCYVYKYNYLAGYGKLPRFDAVALVPGGEVVFFNGQTGRKFKTFESILPINENITSPKYVLENKILENVFVPVWNTNLTYDVLTAYNPYRDDNGEERFKNIEAGVNAFFDNPLAKSSSYLTRTDKNTGEAKPYYLFNDSSSKVLYYYPGDECLLEYSNYKIQPEIKTSLEQNYDAAISFIEKDEYVKNELYLKEVSENGAETIFYFDYAIAGFPIFLDGFRNDMSSHIEIVVENGVVSRYKKITLCYEISGETDFADLKYDEALRYLGFSEEMESAALGDMALAYKGGGPLDRAAYLNWFIFPKNGNNVTSYPAKDSFREGL